MTGTLTLAMMAEKEVVEKGTALFQRVRRQSRFLENMLAASTNTIRRSIGTLDPALAPVSALFTG